ncbi:MAG: DUF1778 domain-containing protein [Betaproteobacteria bacterium]|nr:DUF1778 domain-containing protein [Betaproteobacteria bacterium]
MSLKQAIVEKPDRTRMERLGFRLDGQTKSLIEQAASIEQRKVADFCLSALADAARRIIAERESISLSNRDREIFFKAITNPPKPSKHLARALAADTRRVA